MFGLNDFKKAKSTNKKALYLQKLIAVNHLFIHEKNTDFYLYMPYIHQSGSVIPIKIRIGKRKYV